MASAASTATTDSANNMTMPSSAGAPLRVDSTSSETVMETLRFEHKWRIPNFSAHQELANVGDYLESIAFPISDTDSHRFRLRLFPDGKDNECRGFLSLFLQIQRCPGARLRFRVNFYVQTVEGPRGCALNRNVVSINKGGIVTASKFFSVESLKVFADPSRSKIPVQSRAARFVPDDTLTIGVDITVFGEQSAKESTLSIPSVPIGPPSFDALFAATGVENGSLGTLPSILLLTTAHHSA